MGCAKKSQTGLSAMACGGTCGGCGRADVLRATCLCGGEACAVCSDFLRSGCLVLSICDAPMQADTYLRANLERALGGGAKISALSPFPHEVWVEGCTSTAPEVVDACSKGLQAQRPLQEDEAPRVGLYGLGTGTCICAEAGTWQRCACGAQPELVRPCGHATCLDCALAGEPCAVCGGQTFSLRDIPSTTEELSEIAQTGIDRFIRSLCLLCPDETIVSLVYACVSTTVRPCVPAGESRAQAGPLTRARPPAGPVLSRWRWHFGRSRGPPPRDIGR